jgi:elongation factor 1 alpha-like protein
MSKTHYVPVGAMSGVNLIGREGQDAVALNTWYSGPTLVELLGPYSFAVAGHQSLTQKMHVDRLQPPRRDLTSPLRFPISNVFKGQGSSTGVWGRVCSGLVQVGECLRVLPGDETAVVKGCHLPFSSLDPF